MKLSFSLLLCFILFLSCNFSPDENKTDANEKQSQVASGYSSGEKQDHVVIVTEGGLGVGVRPPGGGAGLGKYQIMPPNMVGRMVPAMMENDLQTIRALLVSGNYGWTELMEGVYKNDIAMVEGLIKNGPDVNAKTYGGMTALALAVQFENLAMVKKLINAGASPSRDRGLAARLPLEFSIERRNAPIARLVIEAGVDMKGEWSTFADAVKSDMMDTVELMLEKGIDLKSQDELALYAIRRALIASIDNENKEMAHLLIKHGVDVNAADKQGETSLSYAAKTGRIEMVKMLLENGVDLDRHGEKSIKAALLNGQIKIAELLTENGVTLKLDSEFTAEILTKAANTGSRELMDYLFSNNVELANEDMEKAVEKAVDKGYINVAISIAKQLESPARPKAASLIYFHDQEDKCEIKILDINKRTSKLIYTTEKCPDITKDKVFLDDGTKSLLIVMGSTIREIVYSEAVKIGPMINLPFKVNSPVAADSNLPNISKRYNRLVLAGHLADGRLGVINSQSPPVERAEYDLLLWVFDKGEWTMVKEKHCRPFGSCTFEELRGDSLRANMPGTEIIDPLIVFNPYIMKGGVMERTDSSLPEPGRDGEWRYISFSINDHETTVYIYTEEGSHSDKLLTSTPYIKTDRNSKPVQLTEYQCEITIQGRYMLLNEYYGGSKDRMHLIDLESGVTLLSAKNYAAWLYN